MASPLARALFVIVAVLLISLELSLEASTVSAERSPVSHSGHAQLGNRPDNGHDATSSRLVYVHESTQLKINGDAELYIETVVQNTGSQDLGSSEWWIQTPTGAYANIRAWDDEGQLEHTIVKTDNRIDITVDFREPVRSGGSYHFYLAVDVGDISIQEGSTWSFFWNSYVGAGQHAREIIVPAGSTIDSVSPPPTTQTQESLQWVRYNTTIDDPLEVELNYVTRKLTDLELARKFSPYFRIHEDDQYVPMGVDLALQHAAEIKDHGTGAGQEGPLTTGDLASDEWIRQDNAYIDFWGDPLLGGALGGSQHYYINNVKDEADADPIVYARVDRSQSQHIVVQYWLYYFYNSWAIAAVGGLNVHEGDWEMVEVILDANEIPLYAAYSQHSELGEVGAEGGSRKEWNDIAKEGTHPIVYPGHGSHASYFGPYSYLLGTDETAAETRAFVEPSVVQLLPESQDAWLFFAGYWGEKKLPGYSGPSSPGAKEEKWSKPYKWAESIPWDEEAHHHIGKVRVTKEAPCNIGIEDSISHGKFGWFFNEFYSQIASGEYIVNETSQQRSAIIHDSLGLSHFRYKVSWTCEQSPTPSFIDKSSQDPAAGTIEFVDCVSDELVTLTYELPANWQEENSIAFVTLSEDRNFDMNIDLNGDGSVDSTEPPTSQDSEPLVPPSSTCQRVYLPIAQRN